MAQLAGEALDVLRACFVIALVSDNPVQAGAILDRLDSEGYQTLVWNWGSGLHMMAQRAQPALIVLDCDKKRGKGLGLVLRRMQRWSYPAFVDRLILGHLTFACPPPFIVAR